MSEEWQDNIKSQQRTLEQLKAQDAALNQDQIAADIEKVLTQKSHIPRSSLSREKRHTVPEQESDVVDIYGQQPSMSSFYVQKGMANPLLGPRPTKRAPSPIEELPAPAAPAPASQTTRPLASPSSPPSEALNQLTKETQDRYTIFL